MIFSKDPALCLIQTALVEYIEDFLDNRAVILDNLVDYCGCPRDEAISLCGAAVEVLKHMSLKEPIDEPSVPVFLMAEYLSDFWVPFDEKSQALAEIVGTETVDKAINEMIEGMASAYGAVYNYM
jgi:hypothetical protein